MNAANDALHIYNDIVDLAEDKESQNKRFEARSNDSTTTWWPFISSITIKNIVTPSRDSTILQDKSILVGAMFLRGLSASCLRCLLHDSSRSNDPMLHSLASSRVWVILFSAIQAITGQTCATTITGQVLQWQFFFYSFPSEPNNEWKAVQARYFNKLPERRTTCHHETTSYRGVLVHVRPRRGQAQSVLVRTRNKTRPHSLSNGSELDDGDL